LPQLPQLRKSSSLFTHAPSQQVVPTPHIGQVVPPLLELVVELVVEAVLEVVPEVEEAVVLAVPLAPPVPPLAPPAPVSMVTPPPHPRRDERARAVKKLFMPGTVPAERARRKDQPGGQKQGEPWSGRPRLR